MTTRAFRAELKLGHLSISYYIAYVIYLEHVAELRYRRVGVGRLFEPQILKELKSVEPIDIELE